MDAFWLGNRIPNLLREVLAEGALGASFTKVFSETFEKDPEEAKRLLAHTLFVVGVMVSIIVAIGMIGAPWIVKLFTLTVDHRENADEFVRQTIGLTRILFPFIVLMSIGSVASGALHQSGRFFISGISPIFLNFGYVLGALLVAPLLYNWGPEWIYLYIGDKKIVGLAIGVLIGGLGQTTLQIWGIWKPLLKQVKLNKPLFYVSDDLKKVLYLMIPMILAASSSQINMTVNTNFAAALQEGSITWLTMSFRLLHFPIAMIGVALGAVVLPTVTKIIARENGKITDKVSDTFQKALGQLFWLTTPCFIFTYCNSLEIVQLIFQHGKYSEFSTLQTAETLKFYSLALIGFSAIKVLTAFYYAIDKTKYAMNVSLISIAVNFIANYFLVEKFAHLGLAMTSSIVAIVNAIVLFVGLLKFKLTINWRVSLKHLSYLFLFVLVGNFVQNYFREYFLENLMNLGSVKQVFLNSDFQIFGINFKNKISALLVLIGNGMLLTGLYLVSLRLSTGLNPKVLIQSMRRRG